MAWPRGVEEGGVWVGGKKKKRAAQMWWLLRCPLGDEMILRLHLEQLVVSDSKEKVPQLEVSVEHEGSWAMIMLIKYLCMTLSRKFKLF